MKIGFVVNDIETEKAEYTTNRLAMAAKEMGHEAWYMGIGDFAYLPDGSLSTKARSGDAKSYRSLERHLSDVKKPEVEQLLGLEEFDVVMLRNDPADDAESDPWRNNAGVAFGQLIASSGVLVVNDPTSLANALSKAYFQHFPEVVRPRTLISRDEEAVAAAEAAGEITIHDWSDEERARFRTIAQGEWQKVAEGSEMAQKVYDTLTGYLREKNLME